METTVFLKQRGADVTVSDAAPAEELADAIRRLEGMNIAFECGAHRIERFLSADIVIVSPGVPLDIPPVAAAMARGIPVLGELELASRFISEPIIAVSGTNGKTTTTGLVGDMLKASGQRVFVGGNIGTPLMAYIQGKEKVDHLVVEVSSFQLDTSDTFSPRISVLLNITPDHLDRYSGFEAYVASKGRLFKNQTATDSAILNGSDPWVRSLCPVIAAQQLFFTGRSEHESGADISSAGLGFHFHSPQRGAAPDLPALNGKGVEWPHGRKHFQFRHLLENVSAACLASLAAGATLEGVRRALDDYEGLAHRMEYVATIGGIPYYNDSKATNVDAVLRALECLESPVILIMGGRNKGSDFGLLAEPVQRKVRMLILLGEAADEIAGALAGLTDLRKAGSMAEAVETAHAAATGTEKVLLAPACASFDMYRDYKDRGDSFRNAVKLLEKRVKP